MTAAEKTPAPPARPSTSKNSNGLVSSGTSLDVGRRTPITVAAVGAPLRRPSPPEEEHLTVCLYESRAHGRRGETCHPRSAHTLHRRRSNRFSVRREPVAIEPPGHKYLADAAQIAQGLDVGFVRFEGRQLGSHLPADGLHTNDHRGHRSQGRTLRLLGYRCLARKGGHHNNISWPEYHSKHNLSIGLVEGPPTQDIVMLCLEEQRHHPVVGSRIDNGNESLKQYLVLQLFALHRNRVVHQVKD